MRAGAQPWSAWAPHSWAILFPPLLIAACASPIRQDAVPAALTEQVSVLGSRTRVSGLTRRDLRWCRKPCELSTESAPRCLALQFLEHLLLQRTISHSPAVRTMV